MIDTYLTVQTRTAGIYKEKGSKFLSFVLPVRDVDEVKMHLAAYRKKYHDARHLCYAYVLGAERIHYRANDDGEPSGTAGRPILGQINARGLTDVLVVVVRYFGGILLGTGGLITAYKEAAAEALNQALIVEKTVDCMMEVFFEYAFMDAVMSAVKMFGARITAQEFNENCRIKLTAPVAHKSMLCNELEKVTERIVVF